MLVQEKKELKDLQVTLDSKDLQDFKEVLVLEKRGLKDLQDIQVSGDSQDFRVSQVLRDLQVSREQ